MISDTALVLFKDRMVQTNCLPAGPASDSESPPLAKRKLHFHDSVRDAAFLQLGGSAGLRFLKPAVS